MSAVESGLNELTLSALEMAAIGAVSRREVWPSVVDESEGGYGGVRELVLGLAERP
jgi:hypothetical protein